MARVSAGCAVQGRTLTEMRPMLELPCSYGQYVCRSIAFFLLLIYWKGSMPLPSRCAPTPQAPRTGTPLGASPLPCTHAG